MRSLDDVLRAAQGPISLIAGDHTVLHDGVVACIEGRGADRFAQLRNACADIAIDHAGPSLGAPVWIVGASFATGDTWPGFPDAQAVLPLRQWTWADGKLYLTTCQAPAADLESAGPIAESDVDAPAWHAMVGTATEAIRRGDVAKVVLCRSHAEASKSDALPTFLRLRELESGTGFFISRGGATMFGCTPETLVRLQQGSVVTHALAGTAKTEDAATLNGADKDILEHELVAAFVRERLVEAGIQHVRQGPRRQMALRHVHHLETPIEGQAPDGVHILDIAAQLHPTPAVCGTPRSRSLELIRRLEDVPRGWYSGVIGWFDTAGQGHLSVALRCAHDHAGIRTMFAGAGIVAGSLPDREWLETEHKLASLKESA